VFAQVLFRTQHQFMLDFARVVDDEAHRLTATHPDAGRAEAHGVQHGDSDCALGLIGLACLAYAAAVSVLMAACVVTTRINR